MKPGVCVYPTKKYRGCVACKIFIFITGFIFFLVGRAGDIMIINILTTYFF